MEERGREKKGTWVLLLDQSRGSPCGRPGSGFADYGSLSLSLSISLSLYFYSLYYFYSTGWICPVVDLGLHQVYRSTG